MTNSEYFEKNKISFANAMKIFNKQKKFKSFDKFLVSGHAEPKFKTGDLIGFQLNEETINCGWMHNVVFEDFGYVVFEVVGYTSGNGSYHIKQLTPCESRGVGCIRMVDFEFIDRNCVPY